MPQLFLSSGAMSIKGQRGSHDCPFSIYVDIGSPRLHLTSSDGEGIDKRFTAMFTSEHRSEPPFDSHAINPVDSCLSFPQSWICKSKETDTLTYGIIVLPSKVNLYRATAPVLRAPLGHDLVIGHIFCFTAPNTDASNPYGVYILIFGFCQKVLKTSDNV